MSHCMVPKWNSRHHPRQDQEIQVGEERNNNRSHHQNLSTYVVPMSNNYEVGEEVITWESREQPAVALMHGSHGGIIGTGLTSQTKPHTWNRTGDTLESIVHQATFSNSNNTTSKQRDRDNNREQALKYSTSILMPTSSCEKWRENTITTTTTQQMQVETNDEYNGMKMRSNTNHMPSMPYSCGGIRINSMGTEGINRVEKSGLDVVIKKRVRSDNCGKNSFNDQLVEERTSCAGAGASASGNNITDTTMMSTWTSFDQSSPSQTFKRTPTINTHHHSHSRHCSENQDDENKGESLRSQSSTRRSRAAVVHNQSERRRRDRINEKMMALQRLVPNASKTDKASMLDEVIEYLKQLQAQVNMLSNARTLPQMVMPFGMQQLQMSILGRMGMGIGMGMLDHVNMNFPRNMPQSLTPLLHGAPPPLSTAAAATTSFVPTPFTMPSLVPSLISTPLKPNIDSTNIISTTTLPNFTDAYGTFLAQQSMNMDFFNKMSALYRQQVNQASKKPNTLSHPNNVQGDQ